METLINTIFPPKCFVCAKNFGYICGDCLKKFKFVEKTFCIVCDKPSSMGETHAVCTSVGVPEAILSVYLYDEYVRKCIKMSKYSLKQFSILKSLTYEAVIWLSKSGFIEGEYLVVPIPLSNKKIKVRGFNQAEIISEIVAKRFGYKKDSSVLIRKKDTESQYTHSRKGRFNNLESAFEASSRVLGKNILLVDDICTTGATFIHASKALYDGGARSVRCFSLAKKFRK